MVMKIIIVFRIQKNFIMFVKLLQRIKIANMTIPLSSIASVMFIHWPRVNEKTSPNYSFLAFLTISIFYLPGIGAPLRKLEIHSLQLSERGIILNMIF